MTNCRICGSTLSNDSDHILLSECPLTDQFLSPQSQENEFIANINIYTCRSCGYVQNPVDIDFRHYYRGYEYSSANSSHTRNFMQKYCQNSLDTFFSIHHRQASRIVEPGSGDGAQLKYFLDQSCDVLGIEPSSSLSSIAESKGLKTIRSLFGQSTCSHLPSSFDICISSYTLDHCPDPLDYLITANKLLIHNGLCIFEVHDFDKIYSRNEYCLFEHEHTIYLNSVSAQSLVKACGFEIIDINPLPSGFCRANSLIVVAKKVLNISSKDITTSDFAVLDSMPSLTYLLNNISSFVHRIDQWINDTPGPIVGYGAGGRGVMTLAQLNHSRDISAVLDLAFDGRNVLTPKSHIPVIGPSNFHLFSSSYVLVFSYGYFEEITSSLVELGFHKDRIISLCSFM